VTLTSEEIRLKGLGALHRELGPNGTVQFLEDLKIGRGDYVEERREWVDKTTFDDIRKSIELLRQKKLNSEES